MFDIYTDGSCLGNPGPGGAAWALFMKGEPLSAGDIVEPNMTTNNRMELRGLIDALRALDDQGVPFGQPDVYLRLDSQYVLNGIFMYMPGWIEKNWKKVANDDLFKQIHCLLTGLRAKGYVFHSAWVKAHTTGAAAANPINAQNNILDKRARDAANRAAQIMQDAEIVAYVAETHDEIHDDVPATSPDTWEPKAPSGFINVIVDAPQEAPDDMALLAARMILTAARNPNTTPETLLARIHAMKDDLGL